MKKIRDNIHIKKDLKHLLKDKHFTKQLQKVVSIDFEVLESFMPLYTTRPLPRYILAHGGRGSGKSVQMGGLTIILGIEEPGVRIVCGREIQKSIKESVYQLLRDIIFRMQINHFYTFTNQEIISNTGTKYGFVGIRAGTQLSDSFKSFENAKYFWGEESQSFTQLTLDLVRPTIRAKGSSLMFTANQRTVADPIFKMFNELPDDVKMVLYTTYKDNAKLSKDLVDEAEREKITDPDKYRHVWLGYPETQLSNAIIPVDLVERALHRDPTTPTIGQCVIGVDVARSGVDKTVFIKRVEGNVVDYRVYKTPKEKNLANIEGELLAFSTNHDIIIIDETGIGGGLVDRMRANDRRVIGENFGGKSHSHNCVNRITDLWYHFKNILPYISLKKIAYDFGSDLLQEFTTRLYGYDNMNKYKIQSKDDHKKEIGRSCDLADAVILCYSNYKTGNTANIKHIEKNVWG